MQFLRNLSFFTIVCLFSFASLADTVFLIQLGSYDSSGEADTAWSDLVDNNKSTLNGLTKLNSKISLPPNNEDVYRLQAGPIKNRVEAKAICSKLKTDCFVVETAMFIGNDAEEKMLARNKVILDVQDMDSEQDTDSSSFSLLDEISDAITSPFTSSKEATIDAAAMSEEATEEAVAATKTIEEQVTENVAQKNVILPWLRNKDNKHRVSATFAPDEAADTPVIEKPEAEIAEIVKKPTDVKTTDMAKPQMKSEVIIQKLPSVKVAKKEAKSKPIIKASKQGNVEVAEAIPVPLSDITAATEAAATTNLRKTTAPTIFKGRKALGWKGTPSQSFLQKSLWVKLKYFDSEKSATNYWNNLRKSNPEITKKLRMRVTKPYSQRKTSKKVSMQLGPLLSYKDVQKLCKIASTPELACEIQRDIGVSTANRGKRSVTSGKKYVSRKSLHSRYAGRKVSGASHFWIQVGSYHNRGDAMKVWSELKSQHKELKGLYPHLEHPAYSSSARTIYRLRSGPFSTRVAADNLCSALNADSTPCIVVNN